LRWAPRGDSSVGTQTPIEVAMHRVLSLASGTALILLAACQPSGKPQPLTAADSTALTKVRTDYMAAWNGGHVDAAVALYTDNGELQPSDRPAVRGKNALQAYFNNALGTPTRPKLDVLQGALLGRQDLAVMAGTYTLTPPAPPAPAKGAAPAPPAPIAAKYLVAATKQPDGTWKISYHAFSADAPPAPPPAPAKPARRRGR
jgi:ketosteroid isomerase-like protein